MLMCKEENHSMKIILNKITLTESPTFIDTLEREFDKINEDEEPETSFVTSEGLEKVDERDESSRTSSDKQSPRNLIRNMK